MALPAVPVARAVRVVPVAWPGMPAVRRARREWPGPTVAAVMVVRPVPVAPVVSVPMVLRV